MPLHEMININGIVYEGVVSGCEVVLRGERDSMEDIFELSHTHRKVPYSHGTRRGVCRIYDIMGQEVIGDKILLTLDVRVCTA